MPHRLQPKERYTGQKGLVERFRLRVPDPHVISIVGPVARRTVQQPDCIIERYPAVQDYGDSAAMDLKFALRHEPMDLCVLKRAFLAMDRAELTGWIRSEPSGASARRAWFLFEWLTGERLDISDTKVGNYTWAIDPEKHFTKTLSFRSQRHRISDNLPGTPDLCPLVRRTTTLREYRNRRLVEKAEALVSGCDPQILQRAVRYLFTKETRSTNAIERETADPSREERFVDALRKAAEFDPTSEAELTRLQNLIIGDPRFAASGWRDFQNFVGEPTINHQDRVHFVCPRPDHVRSLMRGFNALFSSQIVGLELDDALKEFTKDSLNDPAPHLDPVVAAAIISFAFVFIHPFEDGNGRIHRFLIHHVLERAGFTPKGLLFPVSAAILRNPSAYERALESVSRAIMPHIDWAWRDGPDGEPEVLVHNDTADLYRYFDATPLAEFLYACVADTIEVDLKQELEYVAAYDRAMRALKQVSAMPDRMAGRFVQLVLANGRIGKDKRRTLFAKLEDAEIERLEALILTAREKPAED